MTKSASVPAMVAPGNGKVASAVRRIPCTIHGGRPVPAPTQPEMPATKPTHQPFAIMRKNQRVSNNLPRHHRKAPNSAAAIINRASPTMMRKAKNTGATGGRSAGGTLFNPGNKPSHEWVSTSAAPCGIEIEKRLVSAFSSGHGKIYKQPGVL